MTHEDRLETALRGLACRACGYRIGEDRPGSDRCACTEAREALAAPSPAADPGAHEEDEDWPAEPKEPCERCGTPTRVWLHLCTDCLLTLAPAPAPAPAAPPPAPPRQEEADRLLRDIATHHAFMAEGNAEGTNEDPVCHCDVCKYVDLLRCPECKWTDGHDPKCGFKAAAASPPPAGGPAPAVRLRCTKCGTWRERLQACPLIGCPDPTADCNREREGR